MKRICIAVAAALLALAVLGIVFRPNRASAQSGQSQTGWLEGAKDWNAAPRCAAFTRVG
jgi:hypothetical protein